MFMMLGKRADVNDIRHVLSSFKIRLSGFHNTLKMRVLNKSQRKSGGNLQINNHETKE